MEHHSVLKYPRNVVVNFRKLDKPTLTRVLRFYGVSPNPELSQNEMAAMTARVFHTATVSEKDVVEKFAMKFCDSTVAPPVAQNCKKRSISSRELLDSTPARLGEQVTTSVWRYLHDVLQLPIS
jgi:Sin3 binding region of histone deacetylase complex subunit SAP30